MDIVLKTIKSRGLWPGFTLALILFKSASRRWFGKHNSLLLSLLMLVIFAASLYMANMVVRNALLTKSGISIWLYVIGFSASLAGILVSLAHFVLKTVFRRQIWLRSIYSMLFSLFLGGAVAFISSKIPTSGTHDISLIALAFVGVLISYKDVFQWFPRSLLVHDMTDMDVGDLSVVSKDGLYRVSVHEAGHALCYGLCKGIPEDAYVNVDPEVHSLMAGQVNIPNPNEIMDLTKERLHWMMLMSLAGVVAEEVVFKNGSILGAGDMEYFNKLAIGFLLAGHGEVFYQSPENELEVNANRAILQRLREHYREQAREFITLNTPALKRIAKAVHDAEFLDCEGIAKVIDEIALPGKWSLLEWPESVPLLNN